MKSEELGVWSEGYTQHFTLPLLTPNTRLDKSPESRYNEQANGVWRSLVSRLVRVQETSGSNPDTPTKSSESAFMRVPMISFNGRDSNNQIGALQNVLNKKTHRSTPKRVVNHFPAVFWCKYYVVFTPVTRMRCMFYLFFHSCAFVLRSPNNH